MADILNIQQVGEAPLLGIEGVPFLVGIARRAEGAAEVRGPSSTRSRPSTTRRSSTPCRGRRSTSCKVKTDKLDGLKGLKIRVPDRQAGDMVNALGMVGVQIPWGETVPALASGAVVGVTTSSVSGVDGKFWEFLKYFYRPTTSGARRSSPSTTTPGRRSRQRTRRRSRISPPSSSRSSGRSRSRPTRPAASA